MLGPHPAPLALDANLQDAPARTLVGIRERCTVLIIATILASLIDPVLIGGVMLSVVAPLLCASRRPVQPKHRDYEDTHFCTHKLERTSMSLPAKAAVNRRHLNERANSGAGF